MKRSPRKIGTVAESAVVGYLTANGWPSAERRALRGVLDAGDVTGCPGLVWEVKGGESAWSAGDLQVAAWLEQTETERVNAAADLGILVIQRKGFGIVRVGSWWAVVPVWALWLHDGYGRDGIEPVRADRVPVRMLLADLVPLLRAGGYGQPVMAGSGRGMARP